MRLFVGPNRQRPKPHPNENRSEATAFTVETHNQSPSSRFAPVLIPQCLCASPFDCSKKVDERLVFN